MSVEVEVGGVYENAADLTPTGTIVAFGGTVAPTGWYLCDGSEKNRLTDIRLFEVIGTNFGRGDNNETFNLPNLQGQFLRGVDNGEGNDPDAATRTATNYGGSGDAVGSVQDFAVEKHSHYVPSEHCDHAHSPYNVAQGTNERSNWIQSHDSGTTGKFSTETRPRNVYVNYIIKN